MIGSLFNEIVRSSDDESPDAGGRDASTVDEAMLSALPVVNAIARRRVLATGWRDEASDLVQRVFCRLVGWRRRNGAKSTALGEHEWRAIAARTAYNESNRATRQPEMLELDENLSATVDASASVSGNSSAEVKSLAMQAWSAVLEMSLLKRRALLLANDELILYLLQFGVDDTELTEALGLDHDQWIDVVQRLPLTDGDIAKLMPTSAGGNLANPGSIRKARFDARLKLREVMQK